MLVKLVVSAWFFLCLDQFTKLLVARHLAEGQSAAVASWLKIRRVTNARGMPLAYHSSVLLLAWVGLIIGICLIIRQGFFFQHQTAQLALGMALGGAGSNIYDQLRRGAVLDFVDLGWWPVFNLADLAITVGVILALLFFR